MSAPPAVLPASIETTTSPEIAALVRAVKAGERGAFDTLYGRFRRFVHGIALSQVGKSDADDLVQEVFIVAYREIATLDEPAKFGGWIATTTRRRASDLRRKRRITEGDVDAIGRDPAPTSEALEVLRAIRALPEAYRETLVMRLVEGLTGPEIAELTGLTHESVRVNLHRGMKLLKEKLK